MPPAKPSGDGLEYGETFRGCREMVGVVQGGGLRLLGSVDLEQLELGAERVPCRRAKMRYEFVAPVAG